MGLPFQLPDGREFDAVGFGTNAVDYLITVPEFPEFGGKEVIRSCTISPGGEAASTMFGLQRLGYKTAYAGPFGDDEAGRVGRASLDDSGVDVSACRVAEGVPTQVAFILIDEDSGERTILWQRDERLAFQPQDAPLDLGSRCRILHLTPHDIDACIAMANAARRAGAIVSLDIDKAVDGVEKLLPLVDICLASEGLISSMTGEPEVEEGLVKFQERYGCPVTGTTLGRNGSIVLAQGRHYRTQAYAVPGRCVDTTGAGDAFRTGFLFGVLQGVSIGECCEMANATAALKCRRPGARDGLPTSRELYEMIKKG